MKQLRGLYAHTFFTSGKILVKYRLRNSTLAWTVQQI